MHYTPLFLCSPRLASAPDQHAYVGSIKGSQSLAQHKDVDKWRSYVDNCIRMWISSVISIENHAGLPDRICTTRIAPGYVDTTPQTVNVDPARQYAPGPAFSTNPHRLRRLWSFLYSL